ncbi:class I SAM-dependent RNA methyltransferase [bacterium]|nr:class I SAM-dependent RNA methyltransferase [bacterium]
MGKQNITDTLTQAGSFFAQTARGLEDLVAEELRMLGAEKVKTQFMGCIFDTDKAGLYRINYMTRLASRILMPIAKFDCWNDNDLYRHIHKLDWTDMLRLNNTFAITAVGKHPVIKHSKFAALRVKDAIVDKFMSELGSRPSIDPIEPDVHFILHLQPKFAILYWDTSGSPLHRRGYRQSSVEAPLQETVAAAIINLADWDEKTPLVDPFCGSGTLIAEAYMKAANIPAGYLRPKWGMRNMPDYDDKLWKKVKKEADANINTEPADLISGSDIDKSAVKATRNNLNLLPGGKDISIERKDYAEIEDLSNRLIVANPPHGIRMKTEEMADWIKKLGDFLKTKCAGSTAILYFGDRQHIKFVGLKPTFKRPLPSGGLDGRAVRYDLFSGRMEDQKK